MARLRSNPRRRAVGALLINPKRPRRFKLVGLRRRMKRRNPKQGVSAYTREKPWTNYPKAKRSKARTSSLKRRKSTRRARRNPLFVSNPLFLGTKTNPRRRKARRSSRRSTRRSSARRSTRRTRRARRNPLFLARRNPVFLSKRNPRRRKARRNGRGYGALFVKNPGSGLAKIPVIGPVLASAMGYVPHSLFGAVSVEPVLFVTQMASPYLPAAMPFSLTVGLGGLLVGALVKRFGPFSAGTNEKLATACVAASAGVAYYVWRTGDDAPAAEKMGSLVSAGLGNPLAGAIMGDAGGVYMLPDYGTQAVPTQQFVGQTAIPGATRGF